ncbi:N-acetylmuramoyl-L-alanine amidase [Luteolibacter pohnpeiensis]|uniref:N-acetylmuramoyl-L-alanine amidase n=1 Tax=Luteolibacter pohnpeiensis TaxID=454153 RepID=A0A934VWH5_9BACT|nr:N-acetylmuramoyl-L-alanine amidase [Luteolibacter pohnpeiensis]MBK1884617.1 N-acetylmuramoyl-L-alanine amidase [Luteolibacter pohnpeiensis]
MKITDDHWLEDAKRVPLPGGAVMSIRRFLVMHFTSGATAMSSINYWKELGNGVCAHVVIDRDGTIYQCRPFNRTCGHAGASQWKDPNTGITYFDLNSCAIGIEMANGGDSDSLIERFSKLKPLVARHKNGGPVKNWEKYPKAQLDACEAVSKALVARYNLDDLVGHDDIAPERKVDPGPAFPMQAMREACGFQGLPKP